MDDAYLQFGVPGLPYSAVRIPLVADLEEQDEWVARAMNAAQLLANAYYEAFGGAESRPEPARRPPAEPSAPRRSPPPARAIQANGNANRAPTGGTRTGSGLFCPEHGVEMIKSAPQFNKEGDKYYHALAERDFYRMPDGRTVKNHNLYERECVTEDQLASAPF